MRKKYKYDKNPKLDMFIVRLNKDTYYVTEYLNLPSYPSRILITFL